MEKNSNYFKKNKDKIIKHFTVIGLNPTQALNRYTEQSEDEVSHNKFIYNIDIIIKNMTTDENEITVNELEKW